MTYSGQSGQFRACASRYLLGRGRGTSDAVAARLLDPRIDWAELLGLPAPTELELEALCAVLSGSDARRGPAPALERLGLRPLSRALAQRPGRLERAG